MANFELTPPARNFTDNDEEWRVGFEYVDGVAQCTVNGKMFPLSELGLSGAQKSGLKAIAVTAVRHYLLNKLGAVEQ